MKHCLIIIKAMNIFLGSLHILGKKDEGGRSMHSHHAARWVKPLSPSGGEKAKLHRCKKEARCIF